MTKSIVVVDKTGRGHSICAALIATNPDLELHYVPGTGGVFDDRILRSEPLSSFDEIVPFCTRVAPDLVFVSHIEALASGVSDRLRAAGFPVFGVSQEATRLESSKWFCKQICHEREVPTPAAELVTSRARLAAALEASDRRPFMIKADGLTCNGNGAFAVLPGDRPEDVLAEVDLICAQNPDLPFAFLIEDFLPGTDYSAHFFVNETSVVPLPSAQDFKKSHRADAGANCDGMGSVSPHPLDNPLLNRQIERQILRPILDGLAARGIAFVGPIYLGLRITGDGTPSLLEINTRMGDSESQTIFPRIDEDLSDLLFRLATGETINRPVSVGPLECVTITLASGAPRDLEDPGTPRESDWPFGAAGSQAKISFFPARMAENVAIFWAGGTARTMDGALVTRPGRVAHISGLGRTLAEARRRIYASINAVSYSGKRWRPDIAAPTGTV